MGEALLVAILLFTATGSPAFGQTSPETKARELLQVAILTEESEHNPLAAQKLYQQVLAVPQIGEPLKTQAWLRLGLCLLGMGEEQEGYKALEEAAEGEGESAKEASSLLTKEARSRFQLEGRIQQLAAALSMRDPSKIIQELEWIGEPAVPSLIHAVQAEKIDLELINRTFTVLLRIGGEKATEYFESVIRSEDPILKRTLIKLIGGIRQQVDPTVLSTILGLLEDKNPFIRSEFLRTCGDIVPPLELVRFTQDPDASVRISALSHIASRGHVGSQEVMKVLAPILTSSLESKDEEWLSVLRMILGRSHILSTREGRELYFLALSHPGLERSSGSKKWYDGWSGRKVKFVDEWTPQEMLPIARSLGPIHKDQPTLSQRVISQFVAANCTQWNSDLEDALELDALGYGSGAISEWILKNANESLLHPVIQRLARFPAPQDYSVWLSRQELPESALPELTAHIKRGDDFGLFLIRAIARMGTESSARSLENLVLGNPDRLYAFTFNSLIEENSAANNALLQRLIPLGGSDQNSKRARNRALLHLVSENPKGALDVVVRAYQAGLEKDSPDSSRGPKRFLVEIIGTNENPSRVDPALTAKFYNLCLSTSNQDAWEDADNTALLLDHRTKNRGWLVQEPVIEALVTHAMQCPLREDDRRLFIQRVVYQKRGDQKLRRPLIDATLVSDDIELVSAAVSKIYDYLSLPGWRPEFYADLIPTLEQLLTRSDVSVVNTSLNILGKLAPERFAEKAKEMTKHQSAEIRLNAGKYLVENRPSEATSYLIPLLKDPDSSVREETARIMANVLDRESIPALIEAMRDPDYKVRLAVQSSLDRIRTYYETKDHWQTYLSSVDLEASSAAEALLKQTKSEEKQEVRVAAIQSLASLGVKETLPFLIELMKDPDPRIAKEALLAINRLNQVTEEKGED